MTEHWLGIFNEVMVSIYIVPYYIFTDFCNDLSIKQSAGYIVIACLGLSAFVNFAHISFSIIKRARLKYWN